MDILGLQLVSKSNKKVLLRERKRHTDCDVSSTPFAALSGGGGVPILAGGGTYPGGGGTYLGQGSTYFGCKRVPTLAGGGYLPWPGVPTLARVPPPRVWTD